jgi:predicted HAD superfamily Cof-like phosphohydrolase
MNLSNAEAVKVFTVESGHPCPDKPVAMSREQVMFITRMIMSELDELVCTVSNSAEERDMLMLKALENRDKCSDYGLVTPDGPDAQDELIANQFDALVDAWYYSLNIAAKHGVNMSAIFDVVHNANMAKRDPSTGLFLRRDDGKIIKPAGWKAPNITAEISRQRLQGSFPDRSAGSVGTV